MPPIIRTSATWVRTTMTPGLERLRSCAGEPANTAIKAGFATTATPTPRTMFLRTAMSNFFPGARLVAINFRTIKSGNRCPFLPNDISPRCMNTQPYRLLKPMLLSFIALFCLFFAPPLLAHDPGLSTITVRLQRNALDIVLGLSMKDASTLVSLDQNGDGNLAASAVEAARSALGAKLLAALQFKVDNRPAAVALTKCSFDQSGNALLHLTVSGRPVTSLEIRSSMITLLPQGHRQFLSVQDTKGNVLAERLLSMNCNSATVQLTSSQTA